ncbi:MAG: LysM peptidoglycan-binding domain-containing protein [Cyanobacteria bacterium SZAS LIN-2]|nr:LysM peptidoglycan-binding domain-containing protein [Cyanobacteria bacterium SZAS LIN-3]MBS1995121.1 LysM peptidoglycan-binding domain-containing protein [Cyanobacteria bacterium SZAS LIN-2]
MSLDTQGISTKADAALKSPGADGRYNDKANLSEVFKEWANNTSRAENESERQALNQTVQKYLPDCSIIDLGVANGVAVVATYDSKTHHQQLRLVEDFSRVLQDNDLTAKVVVNGQSAQAEVVVKALADNADKRLDPKPADQTRPEVVTRTENEYAIKSGDTLWKIARQTLSSNQSTGDKAAPSRAEIKAFIHQIMELNKTGSHALKDENHIYAGKKLLLPPIKLAESKNNEDERLKILQ